MLMDTYNKIIICVKRSRAAVFRIVRNYSRNVTFIESFGKFWNVPE
jgi:hypothetical protein